MFIRSVRLEFFSEVCPELFATEIVTSNPVEKRLCIRGKTEGAFKGYGTFQWTSAVRAMCIVFLTAIAKSRGAEVDPFLQGMQHSIAASFDYAICKETNWLVDMFGRAADGRALAKRIFAISNSNRKRSGPVVITLNESFLSSDLIEIVLEGKRVQTVEEILKHRESLLAFKQQSRALHCMSPIGRTEEQEVTTVR